MQDRAMLIVAEAIDLFNSKKTDIKDWYLGFPEIKFTVKGRTAGWANPTTINLNLDIMQDERYPDALKDTLIHELAHVIDFYYHNNSNHGTKWQSIMHHMGADSKRCHNYQTTAARRTRKFLYGCDCPQPHIELKSIRHRRQQRAATYRCRVCKGNLTFIKELI